MQMLKTVLALLQAFVMLFTLCACGTPADGGKFCQNCGSRLQQTHPAPEHGRRFIPVALHHNGKYIHQTTIIRRKPL